MFSKETYIKRRTRLKELVKSGVIVLFGNNESPMNYPNNTYYPFRQDSSFLYYFGQHRDALAGVIDIDNNREILIGDDIDIEDIVWLGKVNRVAELAAEVGVDNSAPMKALKDICDEAKAKGRKIHFLPPYRHDIMIQIMDLLDIHPSKQKEAASLELIMAVVKQRATKEQQEIEAIERACDVGYLMHTTAMKVTRAGLTEKYVGGIIDSVALSNATKNSFPTIFSQHGEIMHGIPSYDILEEGRLALCDCGCELDDYCSDNTRVTPISGKFTQQQRDIYHAVEAAHDWVITNAKPGVKWLDMHLGACRIITDHLKAIGLMKGDTEEAVRQGAHALFMPHGLGHMMGLDVHDMEGLGQNYVGFDDEVQPSTQFGLNCLRCGRRLQVGFVMTDEPGIYFIPHLIDLWKGQGMHKSFINYEAIEPFRNFGGVRLEDDIFITETGCRIIGDNIIPYHIDDVEEFIKKD